MMAEDDMNGIGSDEGPGSKHDGVYHLEDEETKYGENEAKQIPTRSKSPNRFNQMNQNKQEQEEIRGIGESISSKLPINHNVDGLISSHLPNTHMTVELLPSGTTSFPSKYYLSRKVWICLVASILILVLGMFIALSLLSIVVFAVSICLTLILLGFAYFFHKQDYARYRACMESGSWLEGLFIFSTGDVVIRYSKIFSRYEKDFPQGSIVHVQGNDNERNLYILYDEADGKKLTYKLNCDYLANDVLPSRIAEIMSQSSTSRSLLTPGSPTYGNIHEL